MFRVLIIESELKKQCELKLLIETCGPPFNICGTVDSIAEARLWLLKNKLPHLLICSVALRDGLSFDIIPDIAAMPLTIYCSESEQYLIQALEHNGIDYLLWPITRERIQLGLRKFLYLEKLISAHSKDPNPELFAWGAHVYKSALLVYSREKIIPLNVNNLHYIYYNNNQVLVHTTNGNDFETRDTLNNISSTLNPWQFFRANRQFIINRNSVTSFQHYFGRKLLINMSTTTPEPVIISKANAPEFIRWVEGVSASPR